MSEISITRFNKKTGRTETPHLHAGGYYALGDPAFGKDKKLAEFEVKAYSLEEVMGFVRRGFHVRMHDGVRKVRPGLISPASLTVHVDGVHV
jgi:hypothetical protein